MRAKKSGEETREEEARRPQQVEDSPERDGLTLQLIEGIRSRGAKNLFDFNVGHYARFRKDRFQAEKLEGKPCVKKHFIFKPHHKLQNNHYKVFFYITQN